MKTSFILSSLLVFVLAAAVDAADKFKSGDAQQAKQAYEAAVKKLEDESAESLEQIKEKYIAALGEAGAKVFGKDAAEAGRIADVIQQLQQARVKKPADKVKALNAEVLWLKTELGRLNERRKVAIPQGRIEFEGHRYLVIADKLTWHFARARCEELGGHLAFVNSQREHVFLTNLGAGRGAWIGGTDEAQEGVWKWTNGKDILTPWTKVDLNENHKEHWLMIGYPGLPPQMIHNLYSGRRSVAICEWDQ